MPFVDLSEFLSDTSLTLQGIGPRDYVVPAPDAETGLKYSALSNIAIAASKGQKVSEAQVAALRLDDEEEQEFVVKMLSQGVVDQMVEDHLAWPIVKIAAQYAFVYFTLGQDVADKALASGALQGKDQTPPNRAARRAATTKRPASTGSRTTRTAPKG